MAVSPKRVMNFEKYSPTENMNTGLIHDYVTGPDRRLKIRHQDSVARHFLKPSFPCCCLHVGILFTFVALGISS